MLDFTDITDFFRNGANNGVIFIILFILCGPALADSNFVIQRMVNFVFFLYIVSVGNVFLLSNFVFKGAIWYLVRPLWVKSVSFKHGGEVIGKLFDTELYFDKVIEIRSMNPLCNSY